MARNRFTALLEEKGIPVGEVHEDPAPPASESPAPLAAVTAAGAAPALAPPPTRLPDPPPIQVGRNGKRSDPRFRQISTYVDSALYKKVRKRLTDEERDFADLLDELLGKWIAS